MNMKWMSITLLVSVPSLVAAHAATHAAASCNLSDVETAVSAAAVGDTVTIPAGTCTWSSELSISSGITLTGSGTPNTGPSTFGSGALNTVIIDNAGSSNALIGVTGIPYGQTFTLALLDVEPESSGTGLVSPIQVAGTCTSNGCPNIRIDNIGFGLTTPWTEAGNGSPADWMIRTDNVFGVIDHNTIPANSNVELLNSNLSAYLGVGGYGDNSWAQPDTFGTASALYMENNVLFVTQAANDCDNNPAGGGVGGCRIVARYNHITGDAGFFSVLYVHGLDTDGRPQGGRQMEAYGNTVNCITSSGCDYGMASFRSGTGFVFGNTLSSTGGGFYDNIAGIYVYRSVFTATSWGACGGSNPYDTNGGTVYYSGTTSTSGTTLTDSSKSWTTNQLVPNGAPYSVYDTTQGWWAEIASNTATTLTIQTSIPEQTNNFNSGDSYQILQAKVCTDQAGRGPGTYVSGSTPSPAAALTQALDPIYEWDDSASPLYHGNMSSDTGRTIANRDWYTDGSNGSPQAQTSPTSPFNGTSGVGFGTLTNRPTTCTPNVGYFATDQGSWNTSGNGFGNGVLYQCSATNSWTVHYTPYSYPHPLTQGTGPAPTAPAPPTNLTATPQ
jgi:hypothetical protein